MRAELVELRAAVRAARHARKGALREARAACRMGRKEARARARGRRAELVAQLRALIKQEKADAATSCELGIARARELVDRHARARAKLEAEKEFRREMRRIEAQNRSRRKELTPRRVRGELARESEDEVRASIPPELVPLWERVKESIRGSNYQSRTEAFLHYAEEHPDEVLEGIEDKTEALVRELEARERAHVRAMRRPPSKARVRELAAAVGGEAPF